MKRNRANQGGPKATNQMNTRLLRAKKRKPASLSSTMTMTMTVMDLTTRIKSLLTSDSAARRLRSRFVNSPKKRVCCILTFWRHNRSYLSHGHFWAEARQLAWTVAALRSAASAAVEDVTQQALLFPFLHPTKIEATVGTTGHQVPHRRTNQNSVSTQSAQTLRHGL